MKTKLLIYSLLGLLVACSAPVAKKEIVVSEFPESKELKATIVHTSPVILAPEAMFIMDDRIYIVQPKKDTIFDIFDLNDCRYLHSLGTRGGGPDEFIYPQANTVQVHDKQFTLFDRTFMRTVAIRPNGSLQIVKSDQMFGSPVNGFLRINDSLCSSYADCFYSLEPGDLEYRVKNLRSGTEVKFSKYPDLSPRKFTGDTRCQVYYKYLTANAARGKFAAFYTHFKFFRIYNVSDTIEIEKEVHVNVPPFEQVADVDDWQKRQLFYGQVFSSDNYIYVYTYLSEIQVWDWDGNPVISYSLDHQFFTFTISEKTKKIYTVSAAEEDWDKFFVYDLSHLP